MVMMKNSDLCHLMVTKPFNARRYKMTRVCYPYPVFFCSLCIFLHCGPPLYGWGSEQKPITPWPAVVCLLVPDVSSTYRIFWVDLTRVMSDVWGWFWWNVQYYRDGGDESLIVTVSLEQEQLHVLFSSCIFCTALHCCVKKEKRKRDRELIISLLASMCVTIGILRC